jgi:hypothetical protein
MHPVQADSGEVIGQPYRAFCCDAGVSRLRADGSEADKRAQLGFEAPAIAASIGESILWPNHFDVST